MTGAGGLLGSAVVETAMARGHVVIAGVHRVRRAWPTDVHVIPLDLTLPRSTEKFIEQAQADWVVHTAAMTDVDRCEQDPAAAIILNVAGTRFLVEAVRTAPTRVVYLSTDYVFDGEHGPYAEDDPVAPINVYGRTKYQGEMIVAEDSNRHVIVRSASFLGSGGHGRRTFVDAMVEKMRQSPPLRAAVDQFSNITPVDYLAAAIVEVCERGLGGIWHIAGREVISRYELARQLAVLSGLPVNVVEGVEYLELGRPAVRPLRGGLRVDKAAAALSTTTPTLAESLTEWRTAAHTDLP
ncbi:MAG: SDR family oxidoreductase [Candidatus Zixiibacteriota bacterium]